MRMLFREHGYELLLKDLFEAGSRSKVHNLLCFSIIVGCPFALASAAQRQQHEHAHSTYE